MAILGWFRPFLGTQNFGTWLKHCWIVSFHSVHQGLAIYGHFQASMTQNIPKLAILARFRLFLGKLANCYTCFFRPRELKFGGDMQ